MDAYTDYKTRRHPTSNRKSNRGKRRRRSFVHESRPSFVGNVPIDLEEEYIGPSGRNRYLQPASAFVDWYFSPPDEYDETAEIAISSVEEQSWDLASLALIIGKEAYEAMLREHIEAEKQLEKTIISISIPLQAEQRVENTEDEIIDETWEVVSTGSADLDEWEEIIVE